MEEIYKPLYANKCGLREKASKQPQSEVNIEYLRCTVDTTLYIYTYLFDALHAISEVRIIENKMTKVNLLSFGIFEPTDVIINNRVIN